MSPNHLPEGTTHYELMLTERVTRDLMADHRDIQYDEEFKPSFPLSVLIDDYLDNQDLPTKEAYKDDIILRNHAVEEIFSYAKDCHEYKAVWDARLKGQETGDYYEAERLVGRIRGKIEQRLLTAANPKVSLYDVDDPSAALEALLEAEIDKDAEMFSKQHYDEQERLDALREQDDYAEQKLKGESEALQYYEQWKSFPVENENEVKRIREFFDSGQETKFGEKISEVYVLALERKFAELCLQHEFRELAEETHNAAVAAKEKIAKGSTVRTELPDGQQTIDDVIAQNAEATPEEKAQRTAAAENNIKSEKGKEKNMGTGTTQKPSPTGGSSRNFRGNNGGPAGQHQKSGNGDARVDAGFFNYDILPDGDQLQQEPAPGLSEPPPPDDGIFRPHQASAAAREQKSNMDRMHEAQRNYPKQGKQAAQGVQAGIAIGRVLTLPDPEEVEVQKVRFKRRPGRWLKMKLTAFYLRHRKSVNIVAKMTAFIALQLGVGTLAGRFEFKEDRHFVQMVIMTVMGMVLTSSLAKDGVPVGNAAFIL